MATGGVAVCMSIINNIIIIQWLVCNITEACHMIYLARFIIIIATWVHSTFLRSIGQQQQQKRDLLYLHVHTPQTHVHLTQTHVHLTHELRCYITELGDTTMNVSADTYNHHALHMYT